MRRRRVAAALAVLLLCGEGFLAGSFVNVKAKKIPTFTVYRGKSFFLTVEQKGMKKKTGKKYRYRVANKKIATVSATGKVRGKKAGTTKVTLQRKSDGKKTKVKIKVVDYVKELRLKGAANIVMKAGEKRTLQAVVYPTTAKNRKVVYASSDKSIVTVSSAGRIQARRAGLAVVTVRTKGTTKKGKKISKRIYICVMEETQPVPTPNVPDMGTAVIGGTADKVPEASATPVPGNSGDAGSAGISTPAPSQAPKTLEQAIKEIPSPSSSTLVAATIVAVQGETKSTLYFINCSYQGTMHVAVDGVDLSSSSSVTEVLHRLETEVIGRNTAVYDGPDYIFRITRPTLSDAWGILNTKSKNEYRFMVWEKDTKYGTPYGLIIADGDTSSSIKVY